MHFLLRVWLLYTLSGHSRCWESNMFGRTFFLVYQTIITRAHGILHFCGRDIILTTVPKQMVSVSCRHVSWAQCPHSTGLRVSYATADDVTEVSHSVAFPTQVSRTVYNSRLRVAVTFKLFMGITFTWCGLVRPFTFPKRRPIILFPAYS